MIGGQHRLPIGSDTLVIVRTGDTTFEVTSAVCTHRGCFVIYNGTVLRCPCHGSRFSLDGAVVQGPAERPLKTYEATFDPSTNILSIIV
jgi:Rieske Fe-S protein